MKKIFLLAIVVTIAFSIFGVHSALALFQTVPVTVAGPNLGQSVLPAETGKVELVNQISVTAAAPLVQEQTLTMIGDAVSAEPAATVVAAQAITKAPAATVVAAQAITKAPAATVVAAQAITKAPAAGAAAQAISPEQALLDQFVQSVSGQVAEQVTGVYVPNQFSLPVMQQPAGNTGFVSTDDNTVTQFGPASAYGTIGLLAHNYLSGKMFFNLHEGDAAVIVYGNGSQVEYRITRVERYQALSPNSIYSNFIDLSDPNRVQLTADQVFQRVYTGEGRMVFQTCIEGNGDPSWGRLFVIAEKVNP